MFKKSAYFFSLLPLVFVLAASAGADERAIPYLSGPVLDEAQLLSSVEQGKLERELRSYLPDMQLQVWTLKSLEGEPIESLSIRAVDEWKLGEKSKDNGVLILIAQKDRRVRIEVGRGLEGDITDLSSNRIIREILSPQFRSGRFYDGISMAAAAIYQRAGGTPSRPVVYGKQKRFNIPISLIFAGVLYLAVGALLGVLSGHSGGRRFRSRSGLFYGGSSWGGGGFGGGGFGGGGWSGGGGGFGGGGSSGSW